MMAPDDTIRGRTFSEGTSSSLLYPPDFKAVLASFPCWYLDGMDVIELPQVGSLYGLVNAQLAIYIV